MLQSGLVKAEIVSVESGERVKCLFNPTEYTFTKQNNYKDQKTGNNVPQIEFGGGQPATLEMELFFDTYATAKSSGTPKDVRKEFTDKIWKLMIVDSKLKDAKNKKGRPPKVVFQWGQTWLFKAVIWSGLVLDDSETILICRLAKSANAGEGSTGSMAGSRP